MLQDEETERLVRDVTLTLEKDLCKKNRQSVLTIDIYLPFEKKEYLRQIGKMVEVPIDALNALGIDAYVYALNISTTEFKKHNPFLESEEEHEARKNKEEQKLRRRKQFCKAK